MDARRIRGWLVRSFDLFHRKQSDREFAEELESHLAMHVEDNVRAGMSRQEARRRALIKLGGVAQIKELHREQRGLPMLETLFQDLRFGVRMLRKNPGFSLIAIVTLALGIGANTAIFSVVNGVVLRPLPYQEPEQLVRIWHSKPQIGMTQAVVSGGNVQVWRERAQSFSGVAAFYTTASIITGEGESEELRGAGVSANLLPLLGYQPLLGRGFLPEEEKVGGDPVILLGYVLWQRRFGGDPDIVGRTVALDHTNSHTVIGVMPPQVNFPGRSEFWLPETVTAKGRHDMRQLGVIARLKAGVTRQAAESELQMIHQQLQKQMPDSYKDWAVWSQPLHDSVVGFVRPTLLMLLGAVGLVLLIACANVANLLLVRATARQKEMTMRAALGAGRLRLIRQLLTESSLLAVLGGGLGLLLAKGAVEALIALNPLDVPRLAQVSLDGRVLAFTFLTALVVGLMFGLVPALQASRLELNQALKEGFVQSGGRRWLLWLGLRSFGLREALVVVQTALALVLLAGAGLLIKSFIKLQQVEIGFEPENAVMLTLAPPFNRFPKEAKTYEYYQWLLDELKALPGVSAVGATTGGPTQGALMSSPIIIAGRSVPISRDAQQSFVNIVSPDYFRALGNALKQGRHLTDADNESAPPVVVVNETLARAYFPGENPIGQRIALRGEPDRLMDIVGVTTDLNQFGLEKQNEPTFYIPFRQKDTAYMNLVVRTAADPVALLPALRERILRVDRFTAITRVRTLGELVSASVAQPRFYALLLAVFAGIALTLSVIGLYGVMACTVSRRTHEIGIRIALGAEAGSIQRWVVGQGMLLIGVGLGIGLVAARFLTRLLHDLLFGVKPTDLETFILIAGALAAAALPACWIPARRAARVDPLAALRCE